MTTTAYLLLDAEKGDVNYRARFATTRRNAQGARVPGRSHPQPIPVELSEVEPGVYQFTEQELLDLIAHVLDETVELVVAEAETAVRKELKA